MVVCKCRKATKLYCFVHKVPVCGECICFLDHQICVVRTYSEWVIDGEYDWPPKCCSCESVLDEGPGSLTTRLGCLHVIHTNCLVSHIKGFPPHTAPAGYICPSCSTPIWPPKTVKDSGSHLHSKLQEAILQTGLEKNLFGNHPVSLSAPPPAFASEPLLTIPSSTSLGKEETLVSDGYTASTATEPSRSSVPDIVEIESTATPENYMKTSIPSTTTRKANSHIDRQSSEMSYYTDDEDGNSKKYTKRGPFRQKFLRALLPFWSSALPTLPVMAPSRSANGNDVTEGRTRHQKPSRMDPRKILLIIAIMACLVTMGILYYRIAQRGFAGDFGDEQLRDEQI